jgi:hypothetical protein
MGETSSTKSNPLCPSAQPDWQGSVAIGVVGGTAHEPRLSQFSSPMPVTEELLSLTKPVTPTEVFRFAAPCMCSGCLHFKDQECRLASRIVHLLPVVTDELPACSIRSLCRWWVQEGKAACMRCAQVVTDDYNPSEVMRLAAMPAQISDFR